MHGDYRRRPHHWRERVVIRRPLGCRRRWHLLWQKLYLARRRPWCLIEQKFDHVEIVHRDSRAISKRAPLSIKILTKSMLRSAQARPICCDCQLLASTVLPQLSASAFISSPRSRTSSIVSRKGLFPTSFDFCGLLTSNSIVWLMLHPCHDLLSPPLRPPRPNRMLGGTNLSADIVDANSSTSASREGE